MAYQHIEDILITLHEGQWFGWSDSKNKIYDNFIIHDNSAGRDFLVNNEKPTKSFLESELVRLKDKDEWELLRTQRNQLLSETDHYALQDVDLSDEMITYRQALRDLPETVDINNIIYPDKP